MGDRPIVFGQASQQAPWQPAPPAGASEAAHTLSYASVDLDLAPEPVLEAMDAAGAELREWERILARTGDNVVGELLNRQAVFREWDHCPEGDVYDAQTHAQYYYHAHPKAERAAGEHGHFHTFLRDRPARGAAAKAKPSPRTAAGPLCHLVGLSMDAHGRLIRLFTTNRWVTGETWRPAEAVIDRLDGFAIGLARPSWPANRWLTAALVFFRPHIEALIHARDRAVADWRAAHPDADALEDRALGVAAQMWITVPDHSAAVARSRRRRA